MAFELPKLAYGFDALEPHIDTKTMETHYGKHHAAYVNNLNNALKGTAFENASLEEILAKAVETPAVRNNGGGHYNHSFFWTLLSAEPSAKPDGKLAEAIDATFGSLDNFKAEFTKLSLSIFGSGWAWLCVKNGTLHLYSTPNQDNTLMPFHKEQGLPILGLDVWEHAYYLLYQNRRVEYVEAFFKVLDWKVVSSKFETLA